jgi:hypothetical protein
MNLNLFAIALAMITVAGCAQETEHSRYSNVGAVSNQAPDLKISSFRIARYVQGSKVTGGGWGWTIMYFQNGQLLPWLGEGAIQPKLEKDRPLCAVTFSQPQSSLIPSELSVLPVSEINTERGFVYMRLDENHSGVADIRCLKANGDVTEQDITTALGDYIIPAK